MLRARSRAVTIDDFEYLAMQASPEVARARCVPPTPDALAAGRAVIKVLLVPATSHDDTAIPLNELRLNDRARTEVMEYLNERRLLTSQVQLDAPEYRFVSVEVEVQSRRRANKEALLAEIQRRLYKLINPAHGGPDGTGWPWERSLFQSEVTALVQGIEGVEFVENVRLFVVDVSNDNRTAVAGTLTCPKDGLLASHTHRVSVK
jgi:predicted phage baseplate assembly protein